MFVVFVFASSLVLSVAAADDYSHVGGSFTFELPDNEQLCFYEHVEKNTEYLLDYRVVRGGHNDVTVYVTDPANKRIYEKTKAHNDRVTISMHAGTYKFCFSNEFSTITHKFVFFSLFPAEPESLREEAGEPPYPSVLTLMQTLMEDIHKQSSEVESLQQDLQSKGALSFNIAEELNKNVMLWSVTVASVILFTSLGQTFVLRRLFHTKLDDTIKRPPTRVTTNLI